MKPINDAERRDCLTTLAMLLEGRGWRTHAGAPDSLPVLYVDSFDPARERQQIVCERGYGNVDWFRFRFGDYIAPVGEVSVATEEVAESLTLTSRYPVNAADEPVM